MKFDEEPTQRTRLGSRDEIAEIRRLYASGDVAAAMQLADQFRARENIPLDAVPVVTVTPDALMKLPLDHRAGFMLTRIDGKSNVAEVIDISAMDRGDALVIIEKLVTLGALSLVGDDDDLTIPRSSVRPSG